LNAEITKAMSDHWENHRFRHGVLLKRATIQVQAGSLAFAGLNLASNAR